MKKIVYIGGGNGQGVFLKMTLNFLKKNNIAEKYHISSVVSMSDDGRTTGMLMRQIQEELGYHFPPSGDLRRSLYSLSSSPYQSDFMRFFETKIEKDISLSSLKIRDMFLLVGAYDLPSFMSELQKYDTAFFDFSLPLEASAVGHKFGNLLMATLYHHFDKNYQAVLDFLGEILQVRGDIFPVTQDSAFIEAEISDGTMVQTQDAISNQVSYNGEIVDFRLMENSRTAQLYPGIKYCIEAADYIVITPGDLYTSILANFLIPGLKEVIEKNKKAKILYCMNSTSKGGETGGYSPKKMLKKFIKYSGIIPDVIFSNNFLPVLSDDEMEIFKNDISVKNGDFLIFSSQEKKKLQEKYPAIQFIEGKYISGGDYHYNEAIIEDVFGRMY